MRQTKCAQHFGPIPREEATGARAMGGLRRLMAFAGPATLIAVGYVDPGNWATDLAGGSRYAYALLCIVLLSSLMAMLLQAMSLRLGIATEMNLAEACLAAYPTVARPLWVCAELAIVATDLAEVLGSAIALRLLFGLPLIAGVVVTVLDVLLLLGLQRRGAGWIEGIVALSVLVIAASFAFELALSRPDLNAVVRGFIPTSKIAQDPEMLYMAVGILGATIMPHNLYLHSSIVQTRDYARTLAGKRVAIRNATVGTALSLTGAMIINSAILVLAASAFHRTGHTDVAQIQDAHRLLSPILGSAAAGGAFAVALLAAGQSATITGTMAGQIVMSGFLHVRLPPWQRRLLTRAVAMVPALVVIATAGDQSAGRLLIGSQILLSMQLPFAVFPLLLLTSDPRRMGGLVNPRWMQALGYVTAILVTGMNFALLATMA